MKNVAFTIVAKNYIGLAKVLENSIKKNNPNVDFLILVADDILPEQEVMIPINVVECRKTLSYSHEEWIEMAFKYSLTEFCTAIKPMLLSVYL